MEGKETPESGPRKPVTVSLRDTVKQARGHASADPQRSARFLPGGAVRFPWLQPGLGLKRWVLLILGGALVFGLGFGQLLSLTQFSLGTGLRPVAGTILALGGLVASALGVYFLFESFTVAVMPERKEDLGLLIYRNRLRQRGPRVVVIGGGTGLSVLLKGMKNYTTNLTAVVTVADDGGSSGRLSKEFEVLPPGDIRSCLVALARSEDLLSNLFQYRFDRGGDLKGHSFGNLLIAALTEVTGDFLQAIKVVSEVLAISGEVLPSTCQRVILEARFEDGALVQGETKISGYGKRIREIGLATLSSGSAAPAAGEEGPPQLTRAKVSPPSQVLERIRAAEFIVIGPGSLFTSIIPNLLVPEIARAINESSASVALVTNIMTQPGETDRFTLGDHVEALHRFTELQRIDHALVNVSPIRKDRLNRYAIKGAIPVALDDAARAQLLDRIVMADLVCDEGLIRHDSGKLAVKLMELLEARMVRGVRILRSRT